MKQRYLLALLFVLFYWGARAQVTNTSYIPTVFPKTPNAAAFEKYGDYPVNLYTGVPDISIPLYMIESGGLKVPISLSYHASGIRVNESATWVGLGWSLNAGGNISRSILGGRPDENGGYLTQYRSASSLHPTAVNSDIDYLYQTVVLNGWDTRPDMFSYNLPGHSGKFFFNVNEGYKIDKIPFSPILIKNIGSTSALKFSVLDEQGNLFLLGNTNSYTESTTTRSQSSISSTGITNWMLEKMISQNRRDTVGFSYVSQIMHMPDEVGQSWIVEDQELRYASGTGPTSPTPYAQGVSANAVPANSSADLNEQDPQQITFKNGRVDFKASATARTDINGSGFPLDSINVYNYNFGTKKMELQKSILFDRSYYTAPDGSPGKLRLDGIRILDKAGSVIQRYTFTYNSLAIPKAMSFARDFWGYYNGKNSNTTLIPRMQVEYYPTLYGTTPSQAYIGSTDPNSRDVDSVSMQAGILTSIKYPTGGHTDFTYQTNRYYDAQSVMRLTGGLRITSIASYDSPTGDTPIVKTYQYNKSRPNFLTFGSTGQLNYGFFVHTTRARHYPGPTVPGAAKRVRSFLSEPSNSLTPSEGAPVAYGNVTEYTGTPGSNAGKTVYVFRDKEDELSGTTAFTQVPIVLDYSFARGQLLRKKAYVNNGGVYKPVSEEISTYAGFAGKTYADVGVIVGQAKQTEGIISVAHVNEAYDADSDAFPFTSYSIVSGDSYLTGTTSKIYDTGDTTKVMASTLTYKYDNIKHQQVNRTYSTDSKGNINISVSKFPADYLPDSTATSTTNILLDSMLNRNMQAEAIEKWDSVKNVTTSINAVTGGQLSGYQAGQIAGTIVPYKISRLRVANPLTDFTPSTVTAGNIVADSRYVKMIQFDTYDSKNNILQYTPRTQTPTNIIWDHNYELPIAQIKNADNSIATNAAYTSFEADKGGNWSFSGATQYDVTAPTGWRSYKLTGGDVSSPYFNNTKSMVLSLWAKGAAPSVMYAAVYQTAVPLRSAGGWTNYEYKLAAGSTQAVVSGTASIDELRLYPADAQMTTYTYDTDGLIQMTDTKSQVSRFEYDFASRLKNIKDWNGNIVKNFGYHTYDMTFGNAATATLTFTRDNCPSGTTPQSTTYSVAAGTYWSSTQASADAMAAYDLKTNGQLKADDPAVCGCPVAMVNFTITNSTGINTFQIKFTGPVTYNFYPTTSSTTVSVQAGTYSIQIFPTGTFANHTYKVGSRSSVTAPGTTFTAVSITSSSNESPLTIQ